MSSEKTAEDTGSESRGHQGQGVAAYIPSTAIGLEELGDPQAGIPFSPENTVTPQQPTSISGNSVVMLHISPRSSTSMVPQQQQNGIYADMNSAAVVNSAPDHASADYAQPLCSYSMPQEPQFSGVSSTSCESSTERRSSNIIVKDAKYYDKRRKNNESAKRSRANRRQKQNQIAAKRLQHEDDSLYLQASINVLLQQAINLERNFLGSPQLVGDLPTIFQNLQALNLRLQQLLELSLQELKEQMGEDNSPYLSYQPHHNHFGGPPPPPPPPPSAGAVI